MNRWGARLIALICPAVLLTGAMLARGEATTQPTTSPSHSLLAASPNKFPSTADLIAQMKARRQAEISAPKVALFDLSGPISEKPTDFSLFGGDPGSAVTFRVLIDRLERARKDGNLRGVLVTLDGSGLNLAQAMELRDELVSLRHDGKQVYAYADSYDTPAYLAACGANHVCMMEGGEIEIPGVGFETMFAKGLLDKVGVKADFVQIGEYKGADEMFTRAGASEELKGQLNGLADSIYAQIIESIGTSRNLKSEDVKAMVDDSLIPGHEALDRKLVDHLVDEDGLRDLMSDQLGQKIELVHNYGAEAQESVDFSNPLAFFSLLSRRPAASGKPAVAMIYAEGVIVDGESGGGPFSTSDNVGSETIRDALRVANRDSSIKAVVIRIDSPGGSALASEVMWQAARRVAKNKPLIISIASEAASGGYYLASSGDYIFADPIAIVGSIGVVGGKFVLSDLFTKVGLNTESFLRGRNADLFSSATEWNDRQRSEVTHWMRDTYAQFTRRVMTTRTGKIKDIDAVARGRIYSAKQAHDLGMVDELGGVQSAIGYAAGKAHMHAGEYEVRVLPAPKSFADLFNPRGDSDSESRSPIAPAITISPDSYLMALPRVVRQALAREMQLMVLLQERPVILATPYVMTVR